MTESQALVVIVTGASSGVGLYATAALVQRSGHILVACRALHKARSACAGCRVCPDSVHPGRHCPAGHPDLGAKR